MDRARLATRRARLADAAQSIRDQVSRGELITTEQFQFVRVYDDLTRKSRRALGLPAVGILELMLTRSKA